MSRLFRFALIVLFGVLTACASTMQTIPPSKIPGEILHRSPPKDAQVLWDRASAMEAQNKFLEAVNTYREIAAQYPDNAIAPRALHRAGRILASQEQWNDALAFYSYVATNYPQWNELPELYLDMMKAYLMIGNAEEALKAGSKASQKPEKNFYLGLAYALKGQTDKAISMMTQYVNDPQIAANTDLLFTASKTMAQVVAPEIIGSFLKTSLPENMRIFIHCTAALQEISRGYADQGRKRLEYLQEGLSPENPMSRLIAKILGSASTKELSRELGEADPHKLGLMVPLHGEFSVYGRSIVQGAFLALESWNEHHPNDPVELIVYDTSPYEKDPDKLVARLLKEDKVLALAGPISAKALDSLIEKGYAESVLIAALVADEPDRETIPFHLRMLPGIKEPVDLLVRYAVEKMGIHSFGILHPSDRFGEKALQAFKSAVEQNGAKVVSIVSYPPKSVDFEASIKDLSKQTKEDRQPNNTFEALFLPDTINVVSTIVPQLLYYGITGVPLLGSPLWESPNLPNLANGYLEGSYYVTPFSSFSKDPLSQEFSSKFSQTFGTNPELLQAVGYDTINLLLKLRSSLSASEITRTEMINRARGFRVTESITGITQIDENGHLQRTYKIMTINNNSPVQVLP